MISFHDLCPELHGVICGFLPIKDLLTMQLVSKRMTMYYAIDYKLLHRLRRRKDFQLLRTKSLAAAVQVHLIELLSKLSSRRKWLFLRESIKFGHEELALSLIESGLIDFKLNTAFKLAAQRSQYKLASVLLKIDSVDPFADDYLESLQYIFRNEDQNLPCCLLVAEKAVASGSISHIDYVFYKGLSLGLMEVIKRLLSMSRLHPLQLYWYFRSNPKNKEVADMVIKCIEAARNYGFGNFRYPIPYSMPGEFDRRRKNNSHSDFNIFIIKYGYDFVVKDWLENTSFDPGMCRNIAIRTASQYGHTKIVEMLLERSHATWIQRIFFSKGLVDPAAKNNEALRLAAQNGHLEVVKLLLEHPRVQNRKSSRNKAFQLAAANGHLSLVEFFLENDESVDPFSCKNKALREAAANGHLKVVERLLRIPNVNAGVMNNYAFRITAAMNGHAD